MTKTHLSVWVLPRSHKAESDPRITRANRTGAFIIAACGDETFAIEPELASNNDRRIWPHTAPTQPRVRSR